MVRRLLTHRDCVPRSWLEVDVFCLLPSSSLSPGDSDLEGSYLGECHGTASEASAWDSCILCWGASSAASRSGSHPAPASASGRCRGRFEYLRDLDHVPAF